MEIEEVFVATRETTLAADGLLHDLDGLVDRQPPILLFIDTAIDERARFRDCHDELVERAPPKQVLGQIEVHRRCRRYRIVGPDYLEQRMEASVSVPCDEYASDHLPNNTNLDNCCP